MKLCHMTSFEEVEEGKHNIPEPSIQRVEIDYGNANAWKRTWKYLTTSNRFRLTKDWKITIPDKTQVMVPKGFEFDGASIPWFLRFFATSFGPLLRGALVHDYGYRHNFLLDWDENAIKIEKGQKYFDDLFRDIAAVTSHLKGLACFAWAGVRSFGHIAWDKHRSRE